MAREMKTRISNLSIFLIPLKPNKLWYHLDTCLFATSSFAIAVDNIEDLFERAGVQIIRFLWENIIVLKKDIPNMSPKWYQMACNAVIANGTIVTTVPWPRKLELLLTALDPKIRLTSAWPREIPVGGGGVACSTLLDQTKTICISVRPHTCNLYMYQLNFMQVKNQEAYTSFDLKNHQRNLCMDMDKIRQCIPTEHYILESIPHVPECIYVKDQGVLLKQENNNYILLMGKMKHPERSAEHAWCKNALQHYTTVVDPSAGQCSTTSLTSVFAGANPS
jgi:N-dimethylarginine dimethylaminohydrolase